MDDESRFSGIVKWGLGVVGLVAIGTAVVMPNRYGILIALAILLLGLVLFGGYFLWQRRRARRQREQFIGDIEKQTAAAPRVISDPKKRADLDKVRGKFQTGLQEFKSRGKDIYKLPWYVIIGESGSGKTEAIRHSEIDFPPGLNKEHQGTGGTVNMDWWFTNRGVILDTAGSMVFPEAGAGEAPEWQEFLRLLKKARPQCPINGLVLVLSIESLIRDSADKISQKASRLAQHLDLIQRTLDVRFPVYLLVTKSDLLTGFREFFDSIEDPLLQHQIFGWSNPDPLDSPFRPDLVDQHLASVAERVCRRRMALLRESSGGGRIGDTQQFFASSYQLGRGSAGARRLDEVDAMFALPESILRLAPRLRRYLETIFVAGEWSAKPVFLRGIYFTSSMREGKALDEAIAFATGLQLDQLPEDRTWDKNRAFFLRDLFHEKVFRESGLVTRATNTLKLLRQRQMAIFGTAGVALLLFLVFVVIARSGLQKSVGKEAAYWKAGAANWKENAANSKLREWLPGTLIHSGGSDDPLRFSYSATNAVDAASGADVIAYQSQVKGFIQKGLHVPWIFWPVKVVSQVQHRPEAQAALFEGGVLRPLVGQTRNKMLKQALSPSDPAAISRHREALLALIQLEADNLSRRGLTGTNAAQNYLRSFISYLTDTNHGPDANLVDTFVWTYTNGATKWPPVAILGGDHLSNNFAIQAGLDSFRRINQSSEMRITNEVRLVDDLVEALKTYAQAETAWLARSDGLCPGLTNDLAPAREAVQRSWKAMQVASNNPSGPLTSIAARYRALERAARGASADAFKDITTGLSEGEKTTGIIYEIQDRVRTFGVDAAKNVSTHYEPRKKIADDLDYAYVAPLSNNPAPAFQARWALYTGVCALASEPPKALRSDLGTEWARFGKMRGMADQFRAGLAAYRGPLTGPVSNACFSIAVDADRRLKEEFIKSYAELAASNLADLARQTPWTIEGITNARSLLEGVSRDLDGRGLGPEEKDKLTLLLPAKQLEDSKRNFIAALDDGVHRQLGFPVLLKSTTTLEVKALVALKSFLAQVETEIANPTWTGFPDGRKAVDKVKERIRLYRYVIDGLVVDGKPGDPVARLKLFAVPEGLKGGSDTSFTYTYRWATLQFGAQKTGEKEITQPPDQLIALGETSLDEKIVFSFSDHATSPLTKPVDSWALARLVQQKGATTEDGKVWRIRLLPSGGPADSKGAVFEAQLDYPLPKPGVWPED